MAQAVLTQLKEHPQAWLRVDTILEHSRNEQARYFALQILDDLIKSRWKVASSSPLFLHRSLLLLSPSSSTLKIIPATSSSLTPLLSLPPCRFLPFSSRCCPPSSVRASRTIW